MIKYQPRSRRVNMKQAKEPWSVTRKQKKIETGFYPEWAETSMRNFFPFFLLTLTHPAWCGWERTTCRLLLTVGGVSLSISEEEDSWVHFWEMAVAQVPQGQWMTNLSSTLHAPFLHQSPPHLNSRTQCHPWEEDNMYPFLDFDLRFFSFFWARNVG